MAAPSVLKVKYKSTTRDQFVEQHEKDVSLGGVFIKTRKGLPPGAELRFELQLADGSPVLAGVGRVAWRRSAETSAQLPAGMGIEFVQLEDKHRPLVRGIAERRAPGVKSRFDDDADAERAQTPEPPPPTPPRPAPPARMQVPRPSLGGAPPTAPPLATSPTPPTTGRRAPGPPPTQEAVPTTTGRRAPGPPPTQESAAPPAPRPSGAHAAPPKPPAAAKAPVPPARASVVGLFSDSPMRQSASDSTEDSARTSFFPTSPTRGARERVQEEVASSDFLVAALSEGGAAQETTARAREEAAEARRVSERPPAADPMADFGAELGAELFGDLRGPTPPPRPSAPNTEAEAQETDFSDVLFDAPDSEPPVTKPVARSSTPSAPSLRDAPDGGDSGEDADEERLSSPQEAVAALSDDEFAGMFDDSEPPPSATAGSLGPESGLAYGDFDLELGAAPSMPAPKLDVQLTERASAAPQKKKRSVAIPITLGVLALVIAGVLTWRGMLVQLPVGITQATDGPEPTEPSAREAPPPAPSDEAPEQRSAGTAAPAPTEATEAEDKPLDPNAEKIRVTVTSAPRGVTVRVGGNDVGRTPVSLDLPVGVPIGISAEMPGFSTDTKRITPGPGEDSVRFKLEPLSFELTVETDPPEVDITALSASGTSPGPFWLGHVEGAFHVTASKTGYQRITRPIRLEDFVEKDGAMRGTIRISLTPLPGVKPQSANAAKKPARAAAAPKQPPAPPEPPAPEAAKVEPPQGEMKITPAAPSPSAPKLDPPKLDPPKLDPPKTDAPKPEAAPAPPATAEPKPSAPEGPRNPYN